MSPAADAHLLGGHNQFTQLPRVQLRWPASRQAALPHRRIYLVAGMLLMALPGLTTAQEVTPPDSAQSQIRAVLRAFYLHLENQNWGRLYPPTSCRRSSLSGGVVPGDLQMVTRDRTRGRGSSHATSMPRPCPAKPSALIDEATIRLDGDWAEVSVPRCSGASAGVDELRMLYFEERWRFIYTDLFDGSPSGEQ